MRLRRADPEEMLVVPEKVRQRARKALAYGDPSTWIDQTLYLIGSNITHHQPGDRMLDEAVTAAQALLAMLDEMQRAEEPIKKW